MRFKKTLKYIILLAPLLQVAPAIAQPFSYVYIQGDKETPFYVKVNDEMVPRYGKNYSIVSELAPGAVNLQILFQQNIFPPEKFNVQVAENSCRGYLLTKRGSGEDSHFVLYDLQTKAYLEPSDNANDDNADNVAAVNERPIVNNTPHTENALQNSTRQPRQNNAPPPQNTPASTTANQPHFIDSVELNNNRVIEASHTGAIGNDIVKSESTTTNPASKRDTNYIAITTSNNEKSLANNDCPNAISEEKFENLYTALSAKNDSEKLSFLLSNLNNCFSTQQVRRLANNLLYEADKFVFVKAVYSRTTDQSNFYTLQDIFETNSGKQSFNLLIHKY